MTDHLRTLQPRDKSLRLAWFKHWSIDYANAVIAEQQWLLEDRAMWYVQLDLNLIGTLLPPAHPFSVHLKLRAKLKSRLCTSTSPLLRSWLLVQSIFKWLNLVSLQTWVRQAGRLKQHCPSQRRATTIIPRCVPCWGGGFLSSCKQKIEVHTR